MKEKFGFPKRSVKENGSNNNSDFEINKLISDLKESELKKISSLSILKPAVISFVALIFSVFLDISTVPVLGHITIDIAKSLYPGWVPLNEGIVALKFWWLPIVSYGLFIIIAFKAYNDSYKMIKTTTSSGSIDKIVSSSMSLVDGIATALPLIGAAILLVSIKMGPEIFLGISVPFEIKALIVLALAKLFEPVLDYIDGRFQKIIDKASDLKDHYYPQKQLEEIKQLTNYLKEKEQLVSTAAVKLSPDELSSYKNNLKEVQTISFDTYQNFKAINQVLERMKLLLDGNREHLTYLDELSKSIDTMAVNLNHEQVSKSLDNLNSIVNREGQ
ncbi:hypothetical protein BMS3Abin04_00674 [bacterium BMS3Abin04]|nr:hypothetical protein BMS3Abin04_00674 [bacterium BMS3Abin04]